MKKQKGEIVIGTIAFVLALVFCGTAAVQHSTGKLADAENVKVAEAK